MPYKQGVAGSNPTVPTEMKKRSSSSRAFFVVMYRNPYSTLTRLTQTPFSVVMRIM